jgi:hypothetical protein
MIEYRDKGHYNSCRVHMTETTADGTAGGWHAYYCRRYSRAEWEFIGVFRYVHRSMIVFAIPANCRLRNHPALVLFSEFTTSGTVSE